MNEAKAMEAEAIKAEQDSRDARASATSPSSEIQKPQSGSRSIQADCEIWKAMLWRGRKIQS